MSSDIVNAHAEVLEDNARVVRGIDMFISHLSYSATALEPTWEMVATEIDPHSFSFAEHNIESNNLSSRIRLQKASTDKPILFPLQESRSQTFDFTMCNPLLQQRGGNTRSADTKELPPNSVCLHRRRSRNDIRPGGEAKFVGQMVQESEMFRTQCKWYTSMLGKMSSVSQIVQMLKERDITNYAITQFVQGQTRRWAVAWSYTDTHLPDSTARISGITPTHSLYTTSTTQHPRTHISPRQERPMTSCKKLSWGVVARRTNENAWSRHARRKRRKVALGNSTREELSSASLDKLVSSTSAVVETSLTLVCSIRWLDSTPEDGVGVSASGEGEEEAEAAVPVLEVQWIYGRERAQFESFVAHVVSKLRGALG
ncbi:hypothetical protein BDQ17DRAFT_1333412 [Cyathus striatus]|nr:hypothetical protein BDQ17DRAFT_1333412 [Cyathus striatus]